VQANEAARNGVEQIIGATAVSLRPNARPDHRWQFIPARDSRNRRVPGLYTRNGRYYALLWADTGNGKKAPRRMPLFDADQKPARTLQVAKEALEVKRHERRENKLPTAGRKPSLNDFCEVYFAKATVQRKRTGTISNERQALARWRDYTGQIRVDQITPALITGFIDKRLKGGVFCGRNLAPVSERTVNLDCLMLRNVLHAALDDGLIRELPRVKKLDEAPPPKRRLLTPEEFDHLIKKCLTACKKNGQQCADYLQFLAFSGSREKEALRIRIGDVDFERQRVTIGGDGLSKNWESRTVEFNAQLGTLLQDMFSRCPPDSQWLFPSPQRGIRDDHAKSFRESLKIARKAAGLDWMGFHDLRHYFCSMCVMAGIDFMTIAAWLGHKDGGILVGKVYGHLLDAHKRNMAARVFSPRVQSPQSREKDTIRG
jgi:integrase